MVNQFFALGRSLNSFQINTPHNAATIVAPWPSPYAIAGPACSDAMILNDIPIPQIIPPSNPRVLSSIWRWAQRWGSALAGHHPVNPDRGERRCQVRAGDRLLGA